MRKILRYLFLLSIFVISLVWYFDPISWMTSIKEKNYHTEERARGSNTYLLDLSKWLTFPIASFSKEIKFLLTANLPADIEIVENISDIRYSVEYEMVDSSGEILVSKIYHLRASYLLFRDDTDNFVSKSFYLGSRLRPTTSESIVIDMQHYPTATHIRLKLNNKESRIEDVVVRSYHLETTPEHRKDIKWERLSKKKQEHLSRGNIYHPSLMTRLEKHRVVSSFWKPNGPLGIDGKRYRTRRLFTLKDSDNIHPYIDIKPIIYADKSLAATRYLPKGSYGIKVANLETNSSLVRLNSYSSTKSLSQKNYILDSDMMTIEHTQLESGPIEVSSDYGIEIDIIDNSTKLELHLPAFISADYYDVNQTASLLYNFYTPSRRYIQLECRSAEETNSTLTMEMRDIDGNIIESIEQHIEAVASRYDYRDDFVPVTEAYRFSFLASEDLHTMEIFSNSPMSIRLSSRSPKIPYPVYSFGKVDKPEYSRLPSWFHMRPEKFDKTDLKERRTKLYTQSKPPIVDPLIESGDYDYEQLFPDEEWRGYTLLLDRKLGRDAIRSQSWSSLYSAIESNHQYRVSFHSRGGVEEVTPRLLYMDLNSTPQDIEIYDGDSPIAKERLYRASGDISLPQLKVDRDYNLTIVSPQTEKFYLSHTDDGVSIHNQRTFILFQKPLHFTLNKRIENESIGIELATPMTALLGEDRVVEFFVDISASNNSIFEEILNQPRDKRAYHRYQLFADISQQDVYNITNPKQKLSLSRSIYLTLGENLPKGKYTITIYPPQDLNQLYIFMNHIILGERSKIQISMERE